MKKIIMVKERKNLQNIIIEKYAIARFKCIFGQIK